MAEGDGHNCESAAKVLEEFVATGLVHAAALHVRRGEQVLIDLGFGAAASADAVFLLASITKCLSVAAVMTLVERGEIDLDAPAAKYLPELNEGARREITVRQLMSHTSGLPDQLPENAALRSRHAGLEEFTAGALRTALLFPPGSRYSYSSMGILLAAEIAQRITRQDFRSFVQQTVCRPLEMRHSALGLGRFSPTEVVRCQVDRAASESGAGDPQTADWDWNSPYWRRLGAPWGGAHGSAADVARFLAEFLSPHGRMLATPTLQEMRRNQNPADMVPRGLGFALGSAFAPPRCSPETFGHGGSTGTLAWADPRTQTICVVLTTLPADAIRPHPRDLVSQRVAETLGARS